MGVVPLHSEEPVQSPLDASHCWPLLQSPASAHCTQRPPEQIGVAALQAGVQVSSQAAWQTETPEAVAPQVPPSGQVPSSQRRAHSPSRQALPSPHSQSLPQLAHLAAAAWQVLPFGLHAWLPLQPAVTQPSQRNETGVQLPVWQVQPVSQSSPVVHGGRHASPLGSGAHFQPVPHWAASVQVSQASAVVVSASHSFVVGLHVWSPSQPLVVQSALGHSAPTHARQLPASQMSLPVHGLAAPHAVAMPQLPFWQLSPRGHWGQLGQPHSTAEQRRPPVVSMQACSPFKQSALDWQEIWLHLPPSHTNPVEHCSSSVQAGWPVAGSSPQAPNASTTRIPSPPNALERPPLAMSRLDHHRATVCGSVD